jgi:hypothetical protein
MKRGVIFMAFSGLGQTTSRVAKPLQSVHKIRTSSNGFNEIITSETPDCKKHPHKEGSAAGDPFEGNEKPRPHRVDAAGAET